jgi:hypothetical protein
MEYMEALNMGLTALGAFLGALISLIISIIIENQRKPKLSIELDNDSLDNNLVGKPAKIIKLLRVHVINKKKPAIFFWMNRDAAMHCNSEIQVFNIDNLLPRFSQPIPTRWPRSDEPLSYLFNPSKKELKQIFDISKYNAVNARNIYPNSEEPIDTFVRFDDDEECYIWNNDTYYRGWRNPEVKIPSGRYYVIITVYSSGDVIKGYYQLENSASIDHFRLIELEKEEKQKLYGK